MSNAKENLTIVTITHFDNRNQYGEIGPPSAAMIKNQRENLLENISGISECRHVVLFNKYSRFGDLQDKYDNNLERYCDDNSIELFRHFNLSYRDSLLDLVNSIRTKYVMIVEHQWYFVRSVDIDDLLHIFEIDEAVNYIRFNKRSNNRGGYDTKIESDRTKPIPLCKVPSYSTNPHLIRKSVLKKWLQISNPDWKHPYHVFKYRNDMGVVRWMKFLRGIVRKYATNKSHVRKFDDVEFVLDTKIKKCVHKNGFDKGHQKFGTYIYGDIGDPKVVEYLDTSS